jgi:hypothetical protein
MSRFAGTIFAIHSGATVKILDARSHFTKSLERNEDTPRPVEKTQ